MTDCLITFPVPDEIITDWAIKLKSSEFKVLLITIYYTLGWITDPQTGMRKKENWATYQQLKEKTGFTAITLATAIDTLIDYNLIEVRDKKGRLVDASYKNRRKDAFVYRFNFIGLKK